MKKMIIFTFLAVTILTYSEATEIVRDSEGKLIMKDVEGNYSEKNYSEGNDSQVREIVKNAQGKNIVLMEDGTWEPEKELESKKEFENKIKLSNVEMSPKRGDGRSLTGSVTNQSRKKLEYVTYNVIWKVDGQDSIVKTFTIKDLDYKETKEFNKRIQLRYISGRDYRIEVLDFKWAD